MFELYFKKLQKNNIKSNLLIVNAPHTSSVLHITKELVQYSKDFVNKCELKVKIIEQFGLKIMWLK